MTGAYQPDAAALRGVLADSVSSRFDQSDLAELVVLQRCCWVQEAIANDTLAVPALHETADEVEAWATSWTTLVVRRRTRLVAAVRGRAEGSDWQVGRLMVAPDLAGRGVGAALLDLIEQAAPQEIRRYVLFTGGRSERNLRFYRRAGYELSQTPAAPGHIAGAVFMIKPRDILQI